MNEPEDSSDVVRVRHKQMLKLVARSFYKELVNYGVNKAEVLSVAGHLLDNVMDPGNTTPRDTEYHNRLFTVRDVRDEWFTHRLLGVNDVTITPLALKFVRRVADWLKDPAIRDNFHSKFPNSVDRLAQYFEATTREYFAIFHGQEMVGVIGADHIDAESGKLEMRKLIGDTNMHGKGIGKRATFLFLYHAFIIREFEKVYVHSMDANIRNLNLNARFGFELEGLFLQDVTIQNQRRDVVRMALQRSVWMQLFFDATTPLPTVSCPP